MGIFVSSIALLNLLVLRAAGLTWWFAGLFSAWASLAIGNQLLLILTELQKQLIPYFESRRNPDLVCEQLNKLGQATEWTEAETKQFEDCQFSAQGELAEGAIFWVEQLRTILKSGSPSDSTSGKIFLALLFWKRPPSSPSTGDIRKEILSIVAALRKVEVE